MKAIVYERYGSPEVLRLAEVEPPFPRQGEVLVRIRAAAANPADWRMMRGEPFLARLEGGLRRPRNAILGTDVAGTIEACGPGTTRFHPGDDVFGSTFGAGWGCFAEFVAVPETAIARKPAELTFEEAAAAPLAAFTALQGLRDKGGIRPGQRVLINGASGGVGTFAVQMAKSFGAEVTGVCSARNADLVRSLGADRVVDYIREDFADGRQAYDLIFCAVGNRSAADYARALERDGTCVVAGFTTLPHMLLQVVLSGGWRSAIGSVTIGSMGTVVPNPEGLALIRQLLVAGDVAPVIDRRYPLREAAEAIRHLERGHARGKVVLTV